MSSYRLMPPDKFAFEQWVERSGYTDEKHFWQSLQTGLSDGTAYDYMVHYLTSLGYTGSGDTQFQQFITDQAATNGLETIYDRLNKIFQGTFSATPSGEAIQTEDGLDLQTEGGLTLETE